MKFGLILKKYSINIFFLLFSFLYILFIENYRDFLFQNETKQFYTMLFKIISDILIIGTGQLLCSVISGIKKKNEFFIRLVSAFFILFLISFILYLLTDFASFNWKMWDAFSVYESALKHDYYIYLHIFTSWYYIIALNIFPFQGGVILFQIIVSSLIFSYIWAGLCRHINNKYKWVLLLSLLLFPVLRMNLQPIRSCIYYVFPLLLFALFYFKYKDNKPLNYIEIFFISLLSAVVCAWRSENIILWLIIPLFLIFLGKEKLSIVKIILFLLIFYSISIFINNSMINAYYSYKILPFKRPLAAILRTDFKTDNKEKDLYIISKCCSIEKLKNLPLNETILAEINYTPSNYDIDNYVKTAIKLIILNPITYIKERADLTKNFKVFILLSDGINDYPEKSLIRRIINTLEYNQAQDKFSFKFWYSPLIPCIFLFIAIIYSFIKRNKMLCLITITSFLLSVIPFLLCAEPFFHYFIQSYIFGWYIFSYFIMATLNKISCYVSYKKAEK